VTKLIGIDVDGTLVGSGGAIHPRVWPAAERARAAGIHLALCSGRPAFALALGYAERLDPQGWHVFQNGASIVHLGTKQSRSVRLPTECVSAVIAEARATGEVLELYSDSDYVVESTSVWAREHAELLGVPFRPRSFESFREPIVRAQWLLSPERAKQVSEKRHRGVEVAQSSSPIMLGTIFVGLTREGVSKGSALRAVTSALAGALPRKLAFAVCDQPIFGMRSVASAARMMNVANP
jgi:hydroxymethylpyrimidine pyrophosphatase-like HAD family hydrolase